ncbi:MAG TPA: hypothetical protein VF189_06440 [Patescibacteria group bacterium]
MTRVETPLEHAQRKEANFAKWEKRIGAIAIASLLLFEIDADVHEIGFGIVEGIINWRRVHWKKQVELLSKGENPTKANPWHLFGHVVSGREKHAKKRNDHLERFGRKSA